MAVAAQEPARSPALAAFPTELARRFEAVVFDWDGTAVPDRRPTRAVSGAASKSCARSGSTWSSSRHARRQRRRAARAPADGPGAALLCVNRGSEVFAATHEGPQLVDRRGRDRRGGGGARRAAAETVARLAAPRRRRGDRVAAAEPAQDRPDPRAGVGRSAEGADRRAARGGGGAAAGAGLDGSARGRRDRARRRREAPGWPIRA